MLPVLWDSFLPIIVLYGGNLVKPKADKLGLTLKVRKRILVRRDVPEHLEVDKYLVRNRLSGRW